MTSVWPPPSEANTMAPALAISATEIPKPSALEVWIPKPAMGENAGFLCTGHSPL